MRCYAVAMTLRIPLQNVSRAATLLAGRPDQEERIKLEGQEAYEIRVFRDCVRLATVFEELEHLLNLLGRARTFQEVRAVLKMYVISWITLWDAAANVVNETMQLGISQRGVNWKAVAAKPMVQTTSIADLVASQEGALRMDQLTRVRNDIVHRGWLVDNEYDELFGEWLYAVGMVVIKDLNNFDGALRSAARESNIHSRLDELKAKKQQELSSHLTETYNVLEQIAPAIEAQLRSRCAA